MLRRWGAFGLGLPVGAAVLIFIDYLVASIRFHHEQAEFEREWSAEVERAPGWDDGLDAP